MIIHLFVSIYRNIKTNWNFHLINSLGLLASFVVCFLIMSYYVYETGFDSYNDDAEKKYLVQMNYSVGGSVVALPPPSIFYELLGKEASVKNVSRVYLNPNPTTLNPDTGEFIKTLNAIRVDRAFFDLFKVDVIQGNLGCIFDNNSGIVVTESFQKKLIASDQAIGQRIKEGGKEYEICAVIKDLPSYSSLNYEIISSTTNLDSLSWQDNVSPLIYFESGDKSNVGAVISRLDAGLKTFFGDESFKVKSISLLDQHFDSDLLPIKGDRKRTNLFLIVGIITLIIALTNYLNINAITLVRDSKGMAIKRMLGASSRHFIFRYFLESTVFILVISAGSYLLVFILNENVQDRMILANGNSSIFELKFFGLASLLVLSAITLLVTFLMFVNSKNKPIDLVRSAQAPSGFSKRSIMAVVIIQFVASSVLILYSMVIFGQRSFLNERELGFSKTNKIIVNFPEGGASMTKAGLEKFRNDLLSYSNVVATSFNSMPGFNSIIDIKSSDAAKSVKLYVIEADENIIDVMGLQLIKGRKFVKTIEESDQVVLNETAARTIFPDAPLEAIGHAIPNSNNTIIVGLVSDFYFGGFNRTIGPIVIKYNPKYHDKLFVSYTGDLADAMKLIINYSKTNFKDQPLECSDFASEYDRLYLPDESKAQIFLIASITSVVISGLGLFGLSFYMVNSRKKEIAIRKIHGATFLDIATRYLLGFLMPITLSFAISIPIFIWMAKDFLSAYAYKMEIKWSFYLVGIVLQILIMMIVVSYQTLKSASLRPVQELRSE